MYNNNDYREKVRKVIKALMDGGFVEHKVCPIYGHDIYYMEKYFDYNDYLRADDIIELAKEYFSTDGMQETVYEFVYDNIIENYTEYESISNFLPEGTVEGIARDLDMSKSEVYDIMLENISIEYDIDGLLSKTTLNVNLMPYVYDEADSEYTSITNGDYENTGLNMFSKRYNGRSVDDILQSYDDNDYLEPSEYELMSEINGIINTFSTFTIFINMSAYDYLMYESYGDIIKPDIIINDANAGIVDFYAGGGSFAEMTIKKDILFKYDEIELEVDGMFNYGTQAIYGGLDYSSTITFVHNLNEDNVREFVNNNYELRSNLYSFCISKYGIDRVNFGAKDVTDRMLLNEIKDFIFDNKTIISPDNLNESNIREFVESDFELKNKIYSFCVKKYKSNRENFATDDITDEMLLNEIKKFIPNIDGTTSEDIEGKDLEGNKPLKLTSKIEDFEETVWQANSYMSEKDVNLSINELSERVMEARGILEQLLVDRDKSVEDFEGEYASLVYNLGDVANLLAAVNFTEEK